MPHAITAMNGAHFLFAFGALAPMTWPSLKTARNTEANSGSSRIASVTLNEGSGFPRHAAEPHKAGAEGEKVSRPRINLSSHP
jgi:hypothetical protein